MHGTRLGPAAAQLQDIPLGFLPAFEAAGRLGSFAAAAAELHVTPSAVSQQIRTLESMLGVALFERTGRATVLTAEGKSYLSDVREALSALATSTARVRRRSQSTVLRVHTVSLVAHEFLLPRLAAFRECFPGLELRIETSNEVVDFRHADCDAAVRLGTSWPDLTIKPLGPTFAAPVCSPALASQIRRTGDLHRCTLLESSGLGKHGFGAVMSAAGLPLTAANVWRFETCHEALKAAEHGLGIAFAVFPLATHWVTSGRVVVPLPDRVPLPGQVCLVYRPADQTRFPFAEISAWFMAEFAALHPLAPGRVDLTRRSSVSSQRRPAGRRTADLATATRRPRRVVSTQNKS